MNQALNSQFPEFSIQEDSYGACLNYTLSGSHHLLNVTFWDHGEDS